MENSKNLIIFDFDNTLIDGNTDMVVLDLAPNLNLRKHASSIAEEKGWGEAMCFGLEQLHKHGLTQEDIKQCILQLQFFDNLKDLLIKLQESKQNDVIIISHSNTYFIEILLEKAELSSAIQAIHTYPAYWTSDGCLKVERYHDQEISCQYCLPDCCKGFVLSNLLDKAESENCRYNKKIFIGDGTADFCAAMRLTKDDLVICRKGYRLHKLIDDWKSNAEVKESIQCMPEHACWSNGSDISNALLAAIH